MLHWARYIERHDGNFSFTKIYLGAGIFAGFAGMRSGFVIAARNRRSTRAGVA